MINEEESRSKSAKQHGLSSICVLKINRTAPQPVLPKAHLVPGKSGTVNTEKRRLKKSKRIQSYSASSAALIL